MRPSRAKYLMAAAVVAATTCLLAIRPAHCQVPSCYDEHGNLKTPEEYHLDEQRMREAARESARRAAAMQAAGTSLNSPEGIRASNCLKFEEQFLKSAKQGKIYNQMAVAQAYMDSTCSECDRRKWEFITVRDYSKAVYWWHKVADRKVSTDPRNVTHIAISEARNRIGVAYLYGMGVPADPAEAARWFLSSMEADVGRTFLERQEVHKNMLLCLREFPAAAVPVVRAAAEAGNTDAQYMLGCAYVEGLGGAQSDADALAWWQKAAVVNWAAQFQIAWAYRAGRAVPADTFEAIRRYQALADKRYIPALLEMAARYREGRGVPQDRNRAIALCQDAIRLNALDHADKYAAVATAKSWVKEMEAGN